MSLLKKAISKLNNTECGDFMNFKTEKMQSIQFLKVAVAVVISAMPAILALTGGVGLYMMLAVFCSLLAYRIYDSQKAYVTADAMILIAFLVYAIISSLWMNDRAGHLYYLTQIMTIVVFSALFADYLNKNNDTNLNGRIMYMLSVSSVLVSVVNIGIWFMKYIPEGKSYSFSAGFNSNDEFGIFMALTMGCIVTLYKKGSKHRRKLVAMAVLSAFALLMAKSISSLIFAAIFLALYILRNKSRKVHVSMILAITIGFIVTFIICCVQNPAFGDCIRTGLLNPLGLGGGGFIAGMQKYASMHYENAEIGLIALITAASGILGLFLCIIILSRQIFVALKTGTWFSTLVYLLTIFMLLSSYKASASAIIMWAALITYNENQLKPIFFSTISKGRIKKIAISLLVVAVLYVVAGFGTIMKNTAHSLYEKEDYLGAYSWYKISARVNFADDESCTMAVKSLRKSGAASEHEEEAIRLLDSAIKRSRNNAANLAEKARLFAACERYDRAITQWETVIAIAPHNDNYKLELSKVLYKVIKINEKGSSGTKDAYKKLLSVSEITQNLDIKKEINDIADKALTYTKGELKDEGEAKAQ